MRIAVIGLGWFGEPLAKELTKLGHEVIGTTSTLEKLQLLESQNLKVELLKAPELPSSELLSADIIFLNVPPPAGKLEWFMQWKWNKKPWLIFISTTSGKLQLEEEWVKQEFSDWTILRFAGLIGYGRHPGKSLSGKQQLTGRRWPVNLIHRDDAVGFSLAVLHQQVMGEIIEVVSDEHHTREEFYQEFCLREGLPLPLFDLKDESKKKPLINKRLKELYELKWPTMIGRSL